MCTDAPYEVIRVSADGSSAFILSDEGTEKDVSLTMVGPKNVERGMFVYARDRVVYKVISAEEAKVVLKLREEAGLPNPPSVAENSEGINTSFRAAA